jgi:hypothetical protein
MWLVSSRLQTTAFPKRFCSLCVLFFELQLRLSSQQVLLVHIQLARPLVRLSGTNGLTTA